MGKREGKRSGDGRERSDGRTKGQSTSRALRNEDRGSMGRVPGIGSTLHEEEEDYPGGQ